jgi:hypothetical protein
LKNRTKESDGLGAIEDAFGLRPGDKTPDGKGRPMRDRNVPHGTLTSEDSPKADEVLADREESGDDRRPTWSPNP